MGISLAAFRRLLISVAIAGIAGLAACGGDGPVDPPPPPPPAVTPLRELAAPKGLRIGTAVGSNFNQNETYMTILRREFNMLTAENAMKFGEIHPNPTEYRFATADAMVNFAVANGMQVRGHTLAWHSQNPGWLNSLTSATTSREQAIGILQEHIATVVGRYRGKIVAWDVVNEAVYDDGVRRRLPRNQSPASVWQRLIGDDYIEIAFHAARAADPDALLFYNDYNLEFSGAKQDSVYNLIKDLKDRGVPIDGIGFQAHFIVGNGTPSRQTLRATFDRFAALGLKIHITELDIRMPVPATAANLEIQAANYRDVVSVCVEHAACDTVVVWGLHDGNSWVPNTFPGQGAALLYDDAFKPKPAYTAVNDYLAGR